MKLSGVIDLVILALVPLAAASAQDSGGGTDPAPGALTALWQKWQVSGALRADYYQSSKSLDNETGFFGATAQLKALPVFTDTLDGKIEVRVTNPALGKGGETRVQLLEGFATIHFSHADLHIGKQIIAWGRADGINPTDNVSPRDFTVMLPFEDDQRFGTTALKLDLYPSQEYTLTLLAAPLFEPSRVPIPSTLTISERKPPHTLSNTQAGIRLNKVGGSTDWSLSYFRGFSLLPTAQAVEHVTGGSGLELHYDRISAFGADFARNFGRFGVRGEIAYVDTANHAGRNPAVRSPYLFWIIGVDRTFHEYLNVNLQFLERRGRYYQDPETIADPRLQSAALLNAIMEGLPARVSHGISSRISHQWRHETLKAEVFGVVDLTGNSRFVRPLVTYAFNDRLKGAIGAEIFAGAAGSQYGSQKANGGVFVELRYGF
jgi:hypothetical protein